MLHDNQFKQWMDHFYGYGSWKAKFWFVGQEEGGGEIPEEVAEKLQYFNDTHPDVNEPTLCDLREMYKRIPFRIEGPRAEKFATLYDHRFEKHAVLHGLWKNLIAFGFGFEGRKAPALLPYQQKEFTFAAEHREALIQLFPLPNPHHHAWYYAWLDMPQYPFLKTRDKYQEHLLQQRMSAILEKMTKHKPAVVLMYGMENINTVKQFIQDYFPGTSFKMVKGIKLKYPQHHRTAIGDTTLILTTQTPTLRHNRVESGFDWYSFGKMVKV